MSIPCKFERSIVSYDEHEIVLRSHHPEIYESALLDDLKALRKHARDARQSKQTGAREAARSARQGAPRGQSLPGTAEHPLQRKQVFAAALKRVNREIAWRSWRRGLRTSKPRAELSPCAVRLETPTGATGT